MKRVLTILTMLVTCVIFAQTPKKMVLIEHNGYLNEVLNPSTTGNLYGTSVHPISPAIPVNHVQNNLFVMGNFNRVNVINYNIIAIPEITIDNNNAEYVKSSRFTPNQTLWEILAKDKN